MAKTFHGLTTGRNKPHNQSHAAQGKPSFKKETGETQPAGGGSGSMAGRVKRASGPHPSIKVGPKLPGSGSSKAKGESLNPPPGFRVKSKG